MHSFSDSRSSVGFLVGERRGDRSSGLRSFESDDDKVAGMLSGQISLVGVGGDGGDGGVFYHVKVEYTLTC